MGTATTAATSSASTPLFAMESLRAEDDVNEDMGLTSLRTREMIQYGSHIAPAFVHSVSSDSAEESGPSDDVMSELSEIDFDVPPEEFILPDDSDAKPLSHMFCAERVSVSNYDSHATTKTELEKLVQHLAQNYQGHKEEESMLAKLAKIVVNMWGIVAVVVVALLLVMYRPYCAVEAAERRPLPDSATLGERIAHYWDAIPNILPCAPCPSGLKCSRLTVVGCRHPQMQLKDKSVCVENNDVGELAWTMSKQIQNLLERRAWEHNCIGSDVEMDIPISKLKSLMKESSTVALHEFDSVFERAMDLVGSNLRTYKVAFDHYGNTCSSYKFDTFRSCWTGGVKYAVQHLARCWRTLVEKVTDNRQEL